MRIGENYSYLPQSSIRAAVPARAREVLRPASESLESDSVSGAALVDAGKREALIQELRDSVQSGRLSGRRRRSQRQDHRSPPR